MTTGLVSIIIPCYNSELYLRDTLKSVLWQTYSDWECLLIDDGSSDRSAEIYNTEYANHDQRFKYHRQNNAGPSAARNRGIELAAGEFIQFLDADDIILPERLKRCVDAFRNYRGAGAVYSDYMTFQSGQGFSRILPARMPHDDAAQSLLFENNLTFVILIHSLMFRTETMRAYPFDLRLHSHAEDVECWARMAVNGVVFQYVDEVLSIYRYTANSLGSDEVTLLLAKLAVLDHYQTDPRCRKYDDHFLAAKRYLQQRLAIGYFMRRSFSTGWETMMTVWKTSSLSARIKMAGWGLLLLLFSTGTIAAVRAWIVKYTPLRWGAWKQVQIWQSPEEVKELFGE